MPVFVEEHGIYRQDLAHIDAQILDPRKSSCLIDKIPESVFVIFNAPDVGIKASSICIPVEPLKCYKRFTFIQEIPAPASVYDPALILYGLNIVEDIFIFFER